ncbi:MAG: DUF5716 family protein [Lachnospiraceae bacterium]|nr:DUF5716 family protein [Lachnospiraceae bacterium]
MNYGFDFTNEICYISISDGKIITDLNVVRCPRDIAERIEFAKKYLEEEHDRAVLVIEEMTPEALEIVCGDQISLISKEEAFAAYLLGQEKNLWKQPVALFEFHEQYFCFFELRRQGNNLLTTRKKEDVSAKKLGEAKEKDRFFTKQTADKLNHNPATHVYLIGEQFAGEWMELSLNSVCNGRRVFMGNHLFANGALLSLQEHSEKLMNVITQDNHPYYWGIRAFHHGQKDVFVPIIQPGSFWFATEGTVEVLVDECEQLEIEGMHSITRQKIKVCLPLNMKQQYPLRTTKIRIRMRCVSTNVIETTVYDVGFGVSREGKGMIYQEEFKLS